MSNRYGITLDSAWTEWAAKEEVSETVAAAVLLICETRPVHEVVAKLTPGEFERVVEIVRRSPDHFPSGTLAALKSRSPMPARRPQSDSVFRGHMRASAELGSHTERAGLAEPTNRAGPSQRDAKDTDCADVYLVLAEGRLILPETTTSIARAHHDLAAEHFVTPTTAARRHDGAGSFRRSTLSRLPQPDLRPRAFQFSRSRFLSAACFTLPTAGVAPMDAAKPQPPAPGGARGVVRQQHGAHPRPQRRDDARRIPGLAGALKSRAACHGRPTPTRSGPTSSLVAQVVTLNPRGRDVQFISCASAAHERQIVICRHQQGFGQHPKPACQCE